MKLTPRMIRESLNKHKLFIKGTLKFEAYHVGRSQCKATKTMIVIPEIIQKLSCQSKGSADNGPDWNTDN